MYNRIAAVCTAFDCLQEKAALYSIAQGRLKTAQAKILGHLM